MLARRHRAVARTLPRCCGDSSLRCGTSRSDFSNSSRNSFGFRLVGAAGFEPATTRTPSVKSGFSSISLGSVRYASRATAPRVSRFRAPMVNDTECYRDLLRVPTKVPTAAVHRISLGRDTPPRLRGCPPRGSAITVDTSRPTRKKSFPKRGRPEAREASRVVAQGGENAFPYIWAQAWSTAGMVRPGTKERWSCFSGC
jgi:hypothetical protein